jgi:hypothetical protein
MTTAKINITELTSRLTYLKGVKGITAEISISKRPKLKSLPSGSDAYVANLFVDGEYNGQISTLPKLVEASVFVAGIMKMKKWA